MHPSKPMSQAIKDLVCEFQTALTAGIDKIYEACRYYVNGIDLDPNSRELFQEACPEIPAAAWAAFELIGRGAMDHRLLWGGGRAQRALRVLPKSTQTELLDTGVKVASGTSHRLVPVESLESKDIRQVFAGQRVRTPDEQRAYLARLRDRAEPSAPTDAEYYIAGNKLVVTRPMKIPLRTLRAMLLKSKER